MARMKIGVQLYTVRDQLAADFAGTLRKVRDVGYTHVELAGMGEYGAAELRKILDDLGLTVSSTHYPIERLEGDVNAAINDAKVLGAEYLVCPYLPEDRRGSEDDWRRAAETLNLAGEACHAQGVPLCYHNHSFEFVRVGDRYALDLLFDETDPNCLQAELDTYWVRHGGEDPAAYIRRYAGRCPILHLKDMADDAERAFAEVGTGTLDFAGIFAAAEEAGCRWGIVEQDVCPGDPIESIRTSLDNLRRMGVAPA